MVSVLSFLDFIYLNTDTIKVETVIIALMIKYIPLPINKPTATVITREIKGGATVIHKSFLSAAITSGGLFSSIVLLGTLLTILGERLYSGNFSKGILL